MLGFCSVRRRRNNMYCMSDSVVLFIAVTTLRDRQNVVHTIDHTLVEQGELLSISVPVWCLCLSPLLSAIPLEFCNAD